MKMDFIIWGFIFIMGVFGIGFNSYLFSVGFHNLDFGFNIERINKAYNLSLMDIGSDSQYRTGIELYNLGTKQIKIAYYSFGFSCIFFIGGLFIILNENNLKSVV